MIKIECPIEKLDLDILGFIDHNITCNIIKDDSIVEKRVLKLPKEIKNVISCKNPRCISTVEQERDQIFILTDPENEVYRCKYCENYLICHNKYSYFVLVLNSPIVSGAPPSIKLGSEPPL